MYISKTFLGAILLAGAGLFGWLSFAVVGQPGQEAAMIAAASAPAWNGGPTAQTASPDAPGALGAQPLAVGEDTNLSLTIVNGASTGQSAGAQVSATATSTSNVSTIASSGTRGGMTVRATGSATAAGPGGSSAGAGAVGVVAIPRVSINGNHIVIASDGSVVFVGDDGKLNANTGPTAASGTVAIDSQGSDVSSGSSTVIASGTNGQTAGTATRVGSGGSSAVSGTTSSGQGQVTHANGSLDSMLAGVGGTPGSVAIAGFEDHSVSVLGDDHLITYDDSNVFVSRNGQINANTGDTDSSGLNVVDAVDSVVRSGNSGDGEGGDDAEEEEDEGAGTPDPGGDVPDMESELGRSLRSLAPASMPTSASMPTTSSASVDDEDVTTSAFGPTAFVIGADGYDDVSIRVAGDRDIVTYDDSNVVLGGNGNVNAQIGDSDTAGAVVMGVRNSYIQAGCEGDLCYSK